MSDRDRVNFKFVGYNFKAPYRGNIFNFLLTQIFHIQLIVVLIVYLHIKLQIPDFSGHLVPAISP